jgi:hypothetical protein
MTGCPPQPMLFSNTGFKNSGGFQGRRFDFGRRGIAAAGLMIQLVTERGIQVKIGGSVRRGAESDVFSSFREKFHRNCEN